MSDYDFIRYFYHNQQSVREICKNLNIDSSNILQKKSSKDKEKLVSNEIKRYIINWYNFVILEDILNEKTNTL